MAEATSAVCPEELRMLHLKQIRVDCLGGVLGVLDGALDDSDFGVEDTAGVDGEGVGAATVGEVDWCRLPFGC